jgi:SAM-dependent methyltransferase
MINSTQNPEGACPICDSSDVTVFLDISGVPCHCNLLWPTREDALKAPRGDIRLGICGECGHIFNILFNPALVQYTEDYENSLHFSPRFRKYAASLASRLIDQYDLHEKDIIEIGCGKGEFLKLLCDLGSNRGIGFDQSHAGKPDESEKSKNVTFIQDFYSERYAHYNADLICCRQVLEHVYNPMDFLIMLRRTIGGRLYTRIFFEVPNSRFILKDLSIWDIVYEHYSYFSAGSIKRAFLESGFSARNMTEDFEGQFLCIEAFPCENPVDLEPDTSESLDVIARNAEAFAGRYGIRVEACKERFHRIENAGQRAVIWGAGSKGVSLLNTLKVRDNIEYVVDINPRKQNMYIAGTGQKIVSPDFLIHYKPDFVFLMNPIYESEIKQIAGNIGLETQIASI